MNEQNTTRSRSDYQIHLNYLSAAEPLPRFIVYRKECGAPGEPRPTPAVSHYRLPPQPAAEDDWPAYWVSMEPLDGYEQFNADMRMNPHLACQVLHFALVESARSKLGAGEYRIPPKPFIKEVSFVMRAHEEGKEQLEVQPYYLKCTRQFGYLVDFHFRMAPGVSFSRKVQQLSLSLDASFKRNLDYYVDRDAKVSAFLDELREVFSNIRMPGTNDLLKLDPDFASLPADRLRTKTYIFGDNRDSRSQFTGLRDHGPLRPLEVAPRLLFVFREQDRQAARTLARALKGIGQRGRYAFPGFKSLFNCELEIDADPIVLPNLEQAAMEDALARVKADRESHPGTLPVFILPGEEDSYLIHKAIFSCAEIPTQVCTLPVLQSENTLKWAIANIALQIFCKAGGHPWKVRPAAAERSLIMGISQSHKLRRTDEGRTQVEKYFAFSVLTDSSGLFQSLQVLGEGDNEDDYLKKLRTSLAGVLSNSAHNFSRVVIHTSFKLKRREIDLIQKVVRDAVDSPDCSQCEFAVVKVNHKSRFFGTNRSVNSLVPYEATRVKLGPGEYLVWFEGIFPDRTTVNKAFPGPTHLKMLRVSDDNAIPHEVLLQDLVNLSGANWRGFNAKSAPVSVFYCHIVAEMVRHFHERGLPLPAIHDLRPWFL